MVSDFTKGKKDRPNERNPEPDSADCRCTCLSQSHAGVRTADRDQLGVRRTEQCRQAGRRAGDTTAGGADQEVRVLRPYRLSGRRQGAEDAQAASDDFLPHDAGPVPGQVGPAVRLSDGRARLRPAPFHAGEADRPRSRTQQRSCPKAGCREGSAGRAWSQAGQQEQGNHRQAGDGDEKHPGCGGVAFGVNVPTQEKGRRDLLSVPSRVSK